MKEVTVHPVRDAVGPEEGLTAGTYEIRVNGNRVSSVLSNRSVACLEAYYHPHAVMTRVIEGDELTDTDLEILNAAA